MDDTVGESIPLRNGPWTQGLEIDIFIVSIPGEIRDHFNS